MMGTETMDCNCKWPTYEFYLDEHHGSASEEKFAQSLPHAIAAVRDVIGFNVPANSVQERACKLAICAAVDVDRAHGGTGGVNDSGNSFVIGSYSSSGAVSSDDMKLTSYLADMRQAIRPLLVGTGLLNQVIL